MRNLLFLSIFTLSLTTSVQAMKVTYDTKAKTCDWVCVDGTKGNKKDVSPYGCGKAAKDGCEDHGGLVRFNYTGIGTILDLQDAKAADGIDRLDSEEDGQVKEENQLFEDASEKEILIND